MYPEMTITFHGGKRVNADFKGFTHKTDQPPEDGGEWTAPEPVDYLFVGLGTCAAHSVLSFCELRKISTDGLQVILRFEKDPEEKRVAKIIQEIHLPEDFPEKYRPVVARAVRSCTVKRYLERPPEIETVVAE
ncbi:MAG: OsmC family protein [Candidatus Eisenbacteria bacterium]|nr:OsmC family protein [Candidatus Eisenbacteria bacterium]